MYQKTWYEMQITFGIEACKGQFITKQGNVLKVCEEYSYIQDHYDQKICPQDIEMEEEELVNEGDKGPSILKSEVEKALKVMKSHWKL